MWARREPVWFAVNAIAESGGHACAVDLHFLTVAQQRSTRSHEQDIVFHTPAARGATLEATLLRDRTSGQRCGAVVVATDPGRGMPLRWHGARVALAAALVVSAVAAAAAPAVRVVQASDDLVFVLPNDTAACPLLWVALSTVGAPANTTRLPDGVTGPGGGGWGFNRAVRLIPLHWTRLGAWRAPEANHRAAHPAAPFQPPQPHHQPI